MKLALAIGVASAGLAFAAFAETTDHRVMIYNNGPPGMAEMGDMDANHDGWLSRAEAAGAADRIFAHLDANHDGKLDQSDHENMAHEMHGDANGHGDHVLHMGDGEDVHIDDGDDVHVENSPDGQTRTVIIHRDSNGSHEHADHDRQSIERHVTIIRQGDDEPDSGVPHPPRPPHPPMFMMLFASSEEADVNGDGALSQEEFRNQHLRFFDASDVNRDGKIRFHAPPRPPEPPTPPEPPVPPTPGH